MHLGLQRMSPSKAQENNIKRMLATKDSVWFRSPTIWIRKRPDMEGKYLNSDKVQWIDPKLTTIINERSVGGTNEMHKAIKLAFYNKINRNQRIWLSPHNYLFSYFEWQLRTLCRIKYLAYSACHYYDSWWEYALSKMPQPLLTYDDGWSALWIKRLEFKKPRNGTCCAESRFVFSANFLSTP